ncbi:hypothetical protein ACFVP3_38605 [Streptomyces sp. NPDC057806]|uniref:hypothetical protein n=1 Tax=Streptomyces sp. NPDC057806 TaxID=3346255 RepID=UPI0036CA2798
MALAFGALLELRPATRPVLLLRVDHVEAHPLRDHHGVPGRGKPEQQAAFLIAFLGQRSNTHGRLSCVLLRLLRDGQQFDGFFIVRAQSFEDFHQGPVRAGGEHVLRLFPGLENTGRIKDASFP